MEKVTKNTQKAIEISNLNMVFGKSHILHDINISMPQGKIYGIMGRNGSGKTVLMKCICGFLRPSSGSVKVWGKEVSAGSGIPDSTGIIIETPGFLENYSGRKNLEFLYAVRNRSDKKAVENAMELVRLDYHSRKWVGKYSLGMKQRLAIAQAFMEGQRLLILDEPMNGLDSQGVQDIRKLFLDLREQGKTILLASHNREDIELLCDEAYEMDGGKLKKKQQGMT